MNSYKYIGADNAFKNAVSFSFTAHNRNDWLRIQGQELKDSKTLLNSTAILTLETTPNIICSLVHWNEVYWIKTIDMRSAHIASLILFTLHNPKNKVHKAFNHIIEQRSQSSLHLEFRKFRGESGMTQAQIFQQSKLGGKEALSKFEHHGYANEKGYNPSLKVFEGWCKVIGVKLVLEKIE